MELANVILLLRQLLRLPAGYDDDDDDDDNPGPPPWDIRYKPKDDLLITKVLRVGMGIIVIIVIIVIDHRAQKQDRVPHTGHPVSYQLNSPA